VAGLPDAPFGPLTSLLPRFGHGNAYPVVLAAVIGLALAALVAATELRRTRRAPAG
jgi:hypothetical protein